VLAPGLVLGIDRNSSPYASPTWQDLTDPAACSTCTIRSKRCSACSSENTASTTVWHSPAWPAHSAGWPVGGPHAGLIRSLFPPRVIWRLDTHRARKTMGRSAAIFAATSVAAFGINAATHLLTLWTGTAIPRTCKATLHYRSAIIGDSVLIPLVNVLLDQQLQEWKRYSQASALEEGSVARLYPTWLTSALQPACLAAALTSTASLHAFQAMAKFTNWTMPEPWKWTPLGYYHAAFMAAQMSYLAYACAVTATEVRQRGADAALTNRMLAAASLLCWFTALLYKDYY
jgi:hypothetical protein